MENKKYKKHTTRDISKLLDRTKLIEIEQNAKDLKKNKK